MENTKREFQAHSQGQAAENLNQQAGENRNAWLKDEMERMVRTSIL